MGVVLRVGVVAGTGRGVDIVGFEVLTVVVAVGVCWDTSRSATLLGKDGLCNIQLYADMQSQNTR